MQQIYRRTPMPKCDFIEIPLRHGCSPVNLLHIFRTPFLKNTFGWLLLQLDSIFRLCHLSFLHYAIYTIYRQFSFRWIIHASYFPSNYYFKVKRVSKNKYQGKIKKLNKIPIRLIRKILIKRRRMLLTSLCTVNLCKNFHFSELST